MKKTRKNIKVKTGHKEKFIQALDKLKKSAYLEDFVKKSTHLVQQISDQISDQIVERIPQKIQDNFLLIGFSAKVEGIDCKLSVFRAVQITKEDIAAENQVIGSQWFGVSISNHSEIKDNQFTAMQFTEFSLNRSDLNNCNVSFSRFSHVTVEESCFSGNKISLCTWSDTSVTESDFTNNSMSRSELSGTIMNSSRLSNLDLTHVTLTDCEFDSCDIQGIEFENCQWKDCVFQNIEAVTETPLKFSNRKWTGKQFANCKSTDEFLKLLEQP